EIGERHVLMLGGRDGFGDLFRWGEVRLLAERDQVGLEARPGQNAQEREHQQRCQGSRGVWDRSHESTSENYGGMRTSGLPALPCSLAFATSFPGREHVPGARNAFRTGVRRVLSGRRILSINREGEGRICKKDPGRIPGNRAGLGELVRLCPEGALEILPFKE